MRFARRSTSSWDIPISSGEHLANIGDHTQDAYLEALGRAGRRLLKTIQQILDYSRMEAGALALDPSAIALAPFI